MVCKDNLGGSSANRVVATEADNIGQAAGAETHTLVTAELPSHSHTEKAYNANSGTNEDICAVSGTGSKVGLAGTNDKGAASISTASVGSDTAHNNMQPYMTLAYIIKT